MKRQPKPHPEKKPKPTAKPRPTTTARLSRHDILRIATETLCDLRSVVAVVNGEEVRGTTRERVETAAKRLGITLP